MPYSHHVQHCMVCTLCVVDVAVLVLQMRVGSEGVCRQVPRNTAENLVHTWDVRKYIGAVLPLSSAPVGRGANGVDAMA
jgi:hypothetical protein